MPTGKPSNPALCQEPCEHLVISEAARRRRSIRARRSRRQSIATPSSCPEQATTVLKARLSGMEHGRSWIIVRSGAATLARRVGFTTARRDRSVAAPRCGCLRVEPEAKGWSSRLSWRGASSQNWLRLDGKAPDGVALATKTGAERPVGVSNWRGLHVVRGPTWPRTPLTICSAGHCLVPPPAALPCCLPTDTSVAVVSVHAAWIICSANRVARPFFSSKL